MYTYNSKVVISTYTNNAIYLKLSTISNGLQSNVNGVSTLGFPFTKITTFVLLMLTLRCQSVQQLLKTLSWFCW